ncbi:MAG: hypothetical protein WDA75_02840 [Candidatus Latescibacterota bacterium]|jgi:hypothetical protein
MARWQTWYRLPRLLAAVPGLLLTAWTLAPAASAQAEGRPEETRLIDCPTAGLVDRGQFALGLRLSGNGGVLAQIDAGVLTRLNIGVAYGGGKVIGDGAVDWNPRLEASARYRLVQESRALPALLVGYETQGYGEYRDRRYRNKSRGLFVSLSKNYLHPMGQIGFHAGANLSREDEDGDDDPSGWVGVDATVNDELTVVGEYDLALNDNGPTSLGSGKGYLNAGVNWAVVPQLRITAYLKNLLENGEPDLSRELSVTYSEEF